MLDAHVADAARGLAPDRDAGEANPDKVQLVTSTSSVVTAG